MSDNAWKPDKLKKAEGENNGVENDHAILERKTRAILNKLCPSRFETLMVHFNALDIDTESKLKLCMELIFEKVCHKFLLLCQCRSRYST